VYAFVECGDGGALLVPVMATEDVTLGDVDAIDELCVISIFDEASQYLSGNSRIRLSTEQKLTFYALFKQATVGPCDRPKPGLMEMVEKAKWSAWKKLGKMRKEEAIAEYVKLLDTVAPQWKQEMGDMEQEDESQHNQQHTGGAGGGGLQTSPSVSRPIQPQPSSAASAPPDLCSLAADGDEAGVQSLLSSGVPLLYSNADGQTALMLAVDRGHEGTVDLLLRKAKEEGVSCDAMLAARDCEGMTALHYACVCERDGCVVQLMEAGADPDVKSNEGETCWDAASAHISELMKKALQKRTKQ